MSISYTKLMNIGKKNLAQFQISSRETQVVINFVKGFIFSCDNGIKIGNKRSSKTEGQFPNI